AQPCGAGRATAWLISRRSFDDQPLAGAIDVCSAAEEVGAGDSELMQAVFYRSWPVAWLTCGRRRSGSVQRPVWAAGVSGICGGLGGGEHPARCPDGGSRIGDSRGGLGAGVAGVVVEGDHAIDL